MELGALICTARVAKCGACPVRGRLQDRKTHGDRREAGPYRI